MVTTRTRMAPRKHSHIRQTSGPLTRAQLRDLEAELRAERARLERSLGADTDAARLDPAERSHASVPSGEPDGGLRIALHDRARARHGAIGAALQRLADGTYGRCAGCGEHIPFGRLLVMPESERCIAC